MGLGAVATQLTTPADASFVLRIAGKVYTNVAPVAWPGDDGAVTSCTIRETAEGSPNQMTFSIEDASNTISFDYGEVVELADLRGTSERLLFGGHLIEQVSRWRARGRMLTVTAIGYDAWLDWKVVPSWSSKTNKNGRVTRITNDRTMVQQLIARYGGDLTAPDGTVASTSTDMDVVSIRKASLREALGRVAETATYADDEPTRFFYVDNYKRVHYYRGSEQLTAPYRVGDGSYTRTVLTTTGLVSLWNLREASGTPAYDGMGYANGTLNGGYTQNVTGGIVNEPQLRAVTFNGTTGYMTASGASLHPGDTFSVEFWCKRGSVGSTQTVWSANTNDVEVGFDATNHLIVYKDGSGTHFVSDDTYNVASGWLHVVVTRSPGNTDVYVNGEAITGTTTARTFLAGAGAINIGRRLSSPDRYFNGTVQHVATYSTKLSAATALAHYNQGITLTPDDWEVTGSAFDGREAVYISGANDAGTGWARIPALNSTAFGQPGRQPERTDIIDRDDSESAAKRRNYGRWYLRKYQDPTRSGQFTITGYDGWRVGQRVYLQSTPDGMDGETGYEIKELDTDVGFGSGVLTYTIQWGKAKWSGARAVARGQKGRR